MLGLHKIPVSIEREGIKIEIKEENGFLVYNRTGGGAETRKILPEKTKDVLFSPVEPLNLPKKISEHLMVRFERPFIIGSGKRRKIFITIPSEIGVFINVEGKYKVIDYFSKSKLKYSMYGEVKNGIICRYWDSPVLKSAPENLDVLSNGLMELEIINEDTKPIEMKREVFNAFGMEIYYSTEMIGMKAKMTITSQNMAETVFLDQPLKEGMAKFIGVFVPVKLLPTDIRFKMDRGL